MIPDNQTYNKKQTSQDSVICDLLAKIIDLRLTNSEIKICHAHLGWFLDGNPTVGYSKQNKGIRLMSWSGADFDEENLNLMGENSMTHPFSTQMFYKSTLKTENGGLIMHKKYSGTAKTL